MEKDNECKIEFEAKNLDSDNPKMIIKVKGKGCKNVNIGEKKFK